MLPGAEPSAAPITADSLAAEICRVLAWPAALNASASMLRLLEGAILQSTRDLIARRLAGGNPAKTIPIADDGASFGRHPASQQLITAENLALDVGAAGAFHVIIGDTLARAELRLALFKAAYGVLQAKLRG